jgi:glycosyltransferase involved in cell wall biosynthesis
MEANMNGKRHSNSWMLVNYWLRNSDALVTFWPRHKRIWESLAGKGREVHCIPMGVNKDFWKPVEGMPRYEGEPSVMTAENHHAIKWPLDAVIAWPWVTENVPDARLHLYNIPDDQAEFWTTLVYNNGANFRSYLTKVCLPHEDLVRVFSQIDYYLNPVRYGDFNRVGLEAAASGCKVISYYGNPYADYWLTEGNQERQAEELAAILSGNVEPLEKQEVPSVMEMATAMKEVYEGL